VILIASPNTSKNVKIKTFLDLKSWVKNNLKADSAARKSAKDGPSGEHSCEA